MRRAGAQTSLPQGKLCCAVTWVPKHLQEQPGWHESCVCEAPTARVEHGSVQNREVPGKDPGPQPGTWVMRSVFVLPEEPTNPIPVSLLQRPASTRGSLQMAKQRARPSLLPTNALKKTPQALQMVNWQNHSTVFLLLLLK